MNEKRALLIDTALALFYTKGINSVGINEILKTSGIAKKTLYGHFEGKEALVLAALKQRHENFITWLEAEISEAESDQEVIKRLFDALGSWFNSKEPSLGDFRGCFFINTAAEFSDKDSDISHYCREHKEEVKRLIKNKLTSQSPLLLDAICILKEGAITTAYVTGKGSEVTSKCIKILSAY
ncbi:TetR/AcrR family transcriptional regulator [Colwellia psychrerythraea]|uniref:Transcriptional regulator, TetR family n=1 Tax=Colwellia psychrerythraea TaxID=28229 RepID=A0A099KSC7_COLPS|nr:TetR/AcrR family transcriptional regulator [Colwellia psychrerythraea]KGJ93634.1 transcriptional regulator, TetR family [Colwellia psychrerythraea]